MNITKFAGVLLICLASVSVNADEWEKSFTAGQTDVNGIYMGGSETMHLVGHAGKLYAAVGYWFDERNIFYGGDNPKTGWAQILRLDSPNGKWQVDLEMSQKHLRPETLKEITLTTDSKGALLDKPITLLVALAFSIDQVKPLAHSFTRNNATGEWVKSALFSGLKIEDGNSVRDLHVHRDTVTGIDRVFATVGKNGIFSGVYDPDEPGFIKWNSTPEMGPVETRPLAIIEANGSLMFSTGRFIYQRIDGERPSYRIAHDMSDLAATVNGAMGGIRGLTAIPNPNGPGDALLFVWNPSKADLGVVYRLEPDTSGGYSRHKEVTIADLASDYLGGTPVHFILAAYNDFLAVPGTDKGEAEYMVGFESVIGLKNKHPVKLRIKSDGTRTRFYRGAMYAIRGADLEYRIEEVNGHIQVDDPPLVAPRCYVRSPFEGEDAIYFGGYDGNGFKSTNKAWIFKKVMSPED
jgi:poly(A) polymerase